MGNSQILDLVKRTQGSCFKRLDRLQSGGLDNGANVMEAAYEFHFIVLRVNLTSGDNTAK